MIDARAACSAKDDDYGGGDVDCDDDADNNELLVTDTLP